MSYWRGLGGFLWKALGAMVVLLAVFEWGIKLKVSTWVIPDWIFLTLITMLLGVAIYTAFWVNRYGKKVYRQGPQRKRKLKPNREHMFVLSALVDTDSQCAVRGYLLDCYVTVFKGKTAADFNLIFNDLRVRDYISSCGTDRYDECTITTDGLSFFKGNLKRFESKYGRIPPIPPEVKESYRLARDF